MTGRGATHLPIIANPDEVTRRRRQRVRTAEKSYGIFWNCQLAKPPAGGVTVGTLFHMAGECGASFDPWKQTADSSDPDIALYAPGNEDACRNLLDRVVADDSQTFTLGGPTGPLVILRKPADDRLPPEARWDSAKLPRHFMIPRSATKDATSAPCSRPS